MSFRRQSSRAVGQNAHSEKLEQLQRKFPEISRETCESLLVGFKWNLDAAITYFTDDRYFPLASEDCQASAEWPSLPVPAKILNQLSSQDNNLPEHISRQSEPNKSQAYENLKDPEWAPEIKRTMKFKKDRNMLQDVLEEELKFESSRRILRLVSIGDGTTVPKVLILLRGVPGSGKSVLSNLIIGISANGVSCSADSFFINKHGRYVFDSSLLSAAHEKCRTDCITAMQGSMTPIIIDNTNTQMWEMIPYGQLALKYGYEIEIMEPNTTWKTNATQLSKKNSHGVPLKKIKEMLRRWDMVTTASLKEAARISNCSNPKSVPKNDTLVHGTPATEWSYQANSNSINKVTPTVSADTKYCKTDQVNFDLLNRTCSEHTTPTCVKSYMELNAPGCSSANKNPSSDYVRFPFQRSQSCDNSCSANLNSDINLEIELESIFSRTSLDDINTQLIKGAEKFEHTSYNVNSSPSHHWDNTTNAENWFTDPFQDNSSEPSSLNPSEEGCHGRSFSFSDNCLKDETKHVGHVVRGMTQETFELDRSHSVPPGFPKLIKRGGALDRSSVSSLRMEDGYKAYEEGNNSYVPVDGEGWFDLQLSSNFIEQVASTNTDMCVSSLSNLPESVRNIRVPPRLAMELFQLFSMSFLQSTVDPTDATDHGGWVPREDTEDDELISQVLQMDEVTSSETPDLKQIMMLEEKLTAREEVQTKIQLAQLQLTMAEKVNLAKLTSGFPTVDKSEIELMYARSRCNYSEALKALKNLHPKKFVGISDVIGKNVSNIPVVRSAENKGFTQFDKQHQKITGAESKAASPIPFYVPPKDESKMTAMDWRKEAMNQALLRTQCRHSLQECLRNAGSSGARYHYSQMMQFHKNQMELANSKAAHLILKNGNNSDKDTIDLHYLFVAEAISALRDFIDNRLESLQKDRKGPKKATIKIITGLGNNSYQKKGKLAPAVIQYLRGRELQFRQFSGTIEVCLKL